MFNFAAMSVLSYWLREFLLSEFANRFELKCEAKQLMLLYCKISCFTRYDILGHPIFHKQVWWNPPANEDILRWIAEILEEEHRPSLYNERGKLLSRSSTYLKVVAVIIPMKNNQNGFQRYKIARSQKL